MEEQINASIAFVDRTDGKFEVRILSCLKGVLDGPHRRSSHSTFNKQDEAIAYAKGLRVGFNQGFSMAETIFGEALRNVSRPQIEVPDALKRG